MRANLICSFVSLFVLAGAPLGCSDDPTSTPSRGEGRAVSRVDPASAAECPRGGSVVSSGVDDDGDGVLDDGEVDGRQVVCQGEAPGPPGPPAPPGPPGQAS